MANERPADQWDPTPDVETPSMMHDLLTLGAEPVAFTTVAAESKEQRDR